MLDEMKILLVFILIFGLIVGLTTNNVDRIMGDEGNHASAGLIIAEMGNAWLSNPLISFSDLRGLAINHHARYKSFGALLAYSPFHYIFLAIVYMLFGLSRFVSLIPTIIEAMVLLFFAYKLARLSYKDKRTAWLSVLLLAFSPMVFYYSSTVMLEIGSTMFLVITVYYFSRYLMDNKDRFLYFTAIAASLAILTKPPMVMIVPVIILTLLWEKKWFSWARNNWKQILIAIVLFIVFLSPWLAETAVLQSEGLSVFTRWQYHAAYGYVQNPVEGFPLMDGTIREINYMQPHQNIVFYISSILYTWYLVPFFILAFVFFFKRGLKLNVVEKQSILMIIIFLAIFSLSGGAQPRFIVYLLPFILIPTARVILRVFKKLKHPIVIAILILSVAQCSHFMISTENAIPAGSFDQASVWVIDDTLAETTVISSAPRPQAFSFALMDRERAVEVQGGAYHPKEASSKIYLFYMPDKQYKLEQMINGSYVESDWEHFGIEYPPVNYIIVHEFYTTKHTYDYDILEFLKGQDEFQVVKTFNGKTPNARTFIYKRV